MRYGGREAAAFLLSAAIFLAAGCGDAPPKDVQAPLVRTQRVAANEAARTVNYAGSVRGRYEKNLAFQVGGRIIARSVNVGDRVEAGASLLRIDASDIVQKSRQADAQVDAAKAQLDLAEVNVARYRELYAAQAVPAALLDQYETGYEAAAASYRQALAQAAEGHNAVSYTELTADSAGVVSALLAEAGQVVAAGQTVVTLVESGDLEVEIAVPEDRLADVPPGRDVSVSFWALGASSVSGTVREVAPVADAVSRTYRVRVALPAPPAGLALGMTANVAVGRVSPPVVHLPLSAVYQTGDSPCVWLVGQDNKVTLQAIAVDGYDGNDALVRGVPDGALVVTAGVHKLREGDEVRTGDAP
mgnify:FL=1